MLHHQPVSSEFNHSTPLKCRIFGHDFSFRAEGPQLMWQCSRRCAVGGSKTYANEPLAARYASAFNRRDTDDLGRRAPLIGLLPLRIWRWLRKPHNTQGSRP